MDYILTEIMNPSDRACALIVSSLLDNALISLLATQMREATEEERKPLFYGEAAFLGSFSAKIRLAYVLGLISKSQRDDLNTIKDIRNTFAHSTKFLEFSHQLISKECDSLWPQDKPIPERLQKMHASKAKYCAKAAEITFALIIQFNHGIGVFSSYQA
jgi:DNA-binding MltR family transcriptional regulator